MKIQTTIVTPEKQKPVEITLGDLFEPKDGRSRDIVQIDEIDETDNATYITFISTVDSVERTYGSLAFVNLYKPFEAEFKE